jgi:serine/threonine protein kinase
MSVPLLIPSGHGLSPLLQILQILNGLEFVHTLGVVHRGLKSVRSVSASSVTQKLSLYHNNILVDGDQNARLADSSLATVLFNASSQLTSAIGESVYGTIQILAPELLSEGTNFTVMSDIYALSITMWEVCPHIFTSVTHNSSP